MLLYLITHAHTQANKEVDATTWALSKQGHKQAIILSQQAFWDQVDCIVLSSEPKTRLTIQPVLAQRTLPVLIEPRLDELRRGGWIDDYAAQVAQAFATPQTPVGGWESAAHALRRFIDGVDAIIQHHDHTAFALVGHGLTLSLYRAHLLGQTTVSFADWQSLSFGAVALVDPIKRQLIEDFAPVASQISRA